MFENINKRLNDNTFLQQAIEAAGDIEIENDVQTEEDAGAPAPQDKPSDAVFEATAPSKQGNNAAVSSTTQLMTDEDAACYAARYTDLNGTDARVHYLSTGYNQGRNPYCTANLTNIQAKRYLSRYPELNQKVGVSSRSAFQYARDFFNSNGHKEKHDISIADSLEKPWKCADGGSTCQCKGRVYLGPLFSSDSGKEIKHFEDLLHWHTESVYTKDGETVGCDIQSFA
jgi:hypothetical protein